MRNSSKNKNMLCSLVIVILIVIGLFFVFKKNNILGLGKLEEGFDSEPMPLKRVDEKPDPDENTIFIVLFYADWCPHCVSTKPAWSKLQKLDNTKINNKTIKIRANNCEGSKVEKELASEVGVEGYPTIKAITNNNTVDHNGGRDEQSLKEFVSEQANKN